MIKLHAMELSEVLWDANHPQAQPLTKQDAALQDVYIQAADAVIAWLDDMGVEEEDSMQNCMDHLAEQLAWKLLHPMQFSGAARDAFEEYAAIAGDRVTDEVREAMAI